MRVLVCGGRNYDNWNTVCWILEAFKSDKTLIIEGGASGADKLASKWAYENQVPNKCFPADWKVHGKAAGPIRNQQMLDEGKPDIVIAFPGGKGTEDMVRRAKEAGIEVIEVIDD